MRDLLNAEVEVSEVEGSEIEERPVEGPDVNEAEELEVEVRPAAMSSESLEAERHLERDKYNLRGLVLR